MGFRFHRSFRLGKSLRLHVSKSGPSLSVGRRGFKVNFSPRGIARTLSLPGTGLSHRSFVSSKRLNVPRPGLRDPATLPDVPIVDPGRFGLVAQQIPSSAGNAKWIVGALGLVGLLAGVSGTVDASVGAFSVVALLVAALLPSRASATASAAAALQQAAIQELTRRIEQFYVATRAFTETPTPAGLRRLLTLKDNLGLRDDEVSSSVMTQLRALRELHDVQSENQGRLPVVRGREHHIGPDTCHFAMDNIRLNRRGREEPASLLLTSARAIALVPSGMLSVAWRDVESTSCNDLVLTVQRSDRKTPWIFECKTAGEALKAAWIADELLARSRMTSTTLSGPETTARALRDKRATCTVEANKGYACRGCMAHDGRQLEIGSSEWAAFERLEHGCTRGATCECGCSLRYAFSAGV